jgi:hypothetical protein
MRPMNINSSRRTMSASYPLFNFGSSGKLAISLGITSCVFYVAAHFSLSCFYRTPSKAHVKNYEKMIQCPTIDWISAILGNIGLSLDEVPILDICLLFSDNDLRAMDEETKWSAVEAAYELVEEILRILRPRIIICCHCMTCGRWDRLGREIWRPAKTGPSGDITPQEPIIPQGNLLPRGRWVPQGIGFPQSKLEFTCSS